MGIIILITIGAFILLMLICGFEDSKIADMPPFVKTLNRQAQIFSINGHVVFGIPSKREIQAYCPYCHHNGKADGPHHYEEYTFTRCNYCGRKLDEK